jgi:hypothetical protein
VAAIKYICFILHHSGVVHADQSTLYQATSAEQQVNLLGHGILVVGPEADAVRGRQGLGLGPPHSNPEANPRKARGVVGTITKVPGVQKERGVDQLQTRGYRHRSVMDERCEVSKARSKLRTNRGVKCFGLRHRLDECIHTCCKLRSSTATHKSWCASTRKKNEKKRRTRNTLRESRARHRREPPLPACPSAAGPSRPSTAHRRPRQSHHLQTPELRLQQPQTLLDLWSKPSSCMARTRPRALLAVHCM